MTKIPKNSNYREAVQEYVFDLTNNHIELEPRFRLNHEDFLMCTNSNCSGAFIIRKRRDDGEYFLGCSKYPRCNKTISIGYNSLKLEFDPQDVTELDVLRHIIINRELKEYIYVGSDYTELINIDYDKLINILGFDVLDKFCKWLTIEVNEGNINTYWHTPFGSPYGGFLVTKFLPYLLYTTKY